VIEDIDADLSFGVGMRINAERGRLLGARLAAVTAEIPDLEAMDEMLLVRGEASGPTGEFLRFIEQSPVSDKIDQFTKGMQATGNGSLALALDMPLRRVDATRLRGEYRFQNNQIAVARPAAADQGQWHAGHQRACDQRRGDQRPGLRRPFKLSVSSPAAASDCRRRQRQRQRPGPPFRARARPAGQQGGLEVGYRDPQAQRRFRRRVGSGRRHLAPARTAGQGGGDPLPLRFGRLAVDGDGEHFRVRLGSVLHAGPSAAARGWRGGVLLGEGKLALPDKSRAAGRPAARRCRCWRTGARRSAAGEARQPSVSTW
jgi:hypothetical protein